MFSRYFLAERGTYLTINTQNDETYTNERIELDGGTWANNRFFGCTLMTLTGEFELEDSNELVDCEALIGPNAPDSVLAQLRPHMSDNAIRYHQPDATSGETVPEEAER